MNAKRFAPFYVVIGGLLLAVLGTGLFMWLSPSKTASVRKIYSAAPAPAEKEGIDAAQFLSTLREELADDTRPETQQYLAFLASEEGQAFLKSSPTLAEINEVMERYIPPTDLRLQRIDEWYRLYFPTGTLEESEQEILALIQQGIQAKGYLLTELRDAHYIFEVKSELHQDERLAPFLYKKFDGDVWRAAKWFNATVTRHFASEADRRMRELNARGDAAQPAPANVTVPVSVDSVDIYRKPASVLPRDDVKAFVDFIDATPARDVASPEPLLPQTTVSPLEMPLWDFTKAVMSELVDISAREQWTPERFEKAREFFRYATAPLDQYGEEEGLRHLKASDPGAALHIERLLQKYQEQKAD